MADLDRQQRLGCLDFDSLEQAEATSTAVGEPATVALSRARSARRSADAFERIADALERLATTAEAREARESGGAA